MTIPVRFQNQVSAHLLGNMLHINNYPLILAIMGNPGMGKTWQLREHLKALGIQIFSISSADLESERAGLPAKLLKEKYVNASISMSKNIPSALVIDDIDTTVGEWEQNTGTINHQGILAFLMHIADNPYYIEDIGKVNRVPIFLTGNKFELLYEPLRRPGRTLKFEWEPEKDEKIEIVSSYLSYTICAKEIAKDLINIYPTKPISFFTNLFSTKRLEVLVELASNAIFKYILINPDYKRQLYQMYIDSNNNIDWEQEILNIKEGEANDKDGN